MSGRYADPGYFGLDYMGRDENGWVRYSADGGRSKLPLQMPEEEYKKLVDDMLDWMEVDELPPHEEERLRELLYMDVDWKAESAHGGDLLEEAIHAIHFAEAVMSEDVLNAVTRGYAADHCIYEAISKLRAVLERHEREAVV